MRRRRVASKRYGGLEVRCRRVASICLKSPGTLEAHCRRRDVEVFASRDRELGRRAAGVQTWRYGGSEVGRRCRYVYEVASRALEVWRCTASEGTSRYGALEMCCRRVDARDLEACCGCRDV